MKLRISAILLCTLFIVSCGNKGREPVVPDPTPLTPIEEQLVLDMLWSIGAQETSDNPLFSLLPAVLNDVIYTASPNGIISALQVNNGSTIWELDLQRSISGGVGASDGMLAIVTDSGTLITIAAENGAIQWEVEVGRAILSPPLVYSGDVFVRTIDGNLLAFNGKDGGEFWKVEFDQPNILVRGEPQPVVAGDYVILGNAGNQLYGFDIAAGFIGWQFRIGERGPRAVTLSQIDRANLTPLAYNNIIYVAVPPQSLVGYEVVTGRTLWTNSLPTGNQLAVDLTAVYGFDSEGRVFALDRINGEKNWDLTDLLYRGITDIHVVKGAVVVADRQGYLHLLNATNGSLLGRYQSGEIVLPGGLRSTGSTLFVSYESGGLDVFDVRSN